MELLSPAGGMAAARAAVQSGADAVYLAGEKFGARKSAENFSIPLLRECADYCHLYGVKVHAAVNTLIKERELSELAEYVREIAEAGVDAFIVQDLGAAQIIKSVVPNAELHASTQMTVTSLEGAKYLEDMGFSRVVLARELSKDEIARICEKTRLETEVFVHGAICMCYSGQCLMSSIIGGRSGNRGMCAQPCRLPYELCADGKAQKSGYLLSPKDLALIDDLKELSDIGVTSLKIEGRLKRPEYVSAVTGVYRKYLDLIENDGTRAVSAEDMAELRGAFSRSGFTNGYFKKQLGKNMMSGEAPGNSGENKFTAAALERARDGANVRKIPVTLTASLKTDAPLCLTLSDFDGHSVSVKSAVLAQTAEHKPLGADRLKEQLLKLGQTPFECVNADVTADEGITIPIKEINAVRRKAAEKLTAARTCRDASRTEEYAPIRRTRKKPERIGLSVQVENEEQLRAALKHNIDVIYAPPSLARMCDSRVRVVVKTADIFREEEINADSVLVSSFAAARYYADKKLFGDFRLNVFNSRTASVFSELERITLSPELNIYEIADLCENVGDDTEIEVIAYGRLTLMLMKNCPVKAALKCARDGRMYSLRDRKGEVFPILCGDIGENGNCTARLLNSKPIFTADKIEDLKKLKINAVRLIFTVENFAQCDKIIDVYERALEGKTVGAPEENSFTRGHFYRGVK